LHMYDTINKEVPPSFNNYTIDKYGKILGKIASGTYGVIYRTETVDGKNYVIKFIRQSGHYIDSNILKEIVYANSMHHPGIIKYLDVYRSVRTNPATANHVKYIFDDTNTNDYTALVMHLYDGNLKELVIEKNYLPYLFYQMISSMAYMESRDIINGDIKPINILYKKCPADGSITETVIADLGISASDECMSIVKINDVFTAGYRAPELCVAKLINKNIPYDSRVDVYAMGCTIYEIVQNEPFIKIHNKQIKIVEILSQIFDQLGAPMGDIIMHKFYNEFGILGKKSDASGASGTSSSTAPVASSSTASGASSSTALNPPVPHIIPFSEYGASYGDYIVEQYYITNYKSLQYPKRLVENPLLNDLLHKMLNPLPSLRIKFSDAQNHPYFNDIKFKNVQCYQGYNIKPLTCRNKVLLYDRQFSFINLQFLENISLDKLQIVTTWMVEVCHNLMLYDKRSPYGDDKYLIQAIDILYRYLCINIKLELDNAQLLALSCLSLAFSLSSNVLYIDTYELAAYAEDKYTADAIVDMAWIVAKALGYDFLATTPWDIINSSNNMNINHRRLANIILALSTPIYEVYIPRYKYNPNLPRLCMNMANIYYNETRTYNQEDTVAMLYILQQIKETYNDNENIETLIMIDDLIQILSNHS
jgi:serine/threonine protein kinase